MDSAFVVSLISDTYVKELRMSLIYEPAGRAREYAPLALNVYRGCGHHCSYCYAPNALKMTASEFNNPAPRKDLIANLDKELKCSGGLFEAVKPPVLLCLSCDPYQPINDEFGLARQVIIRLHDAGYPVHILTKGGTRAVADFDLLTDKRDAFATTLTFIDPGLSKECEPGAALPDNRIEAIRQAHALGIFTWVSLEPVINRDETMRVINTTHEFVDHYKIGKLNHRASAIDWHSFGHEVESIMKTLGKSYYLKDDLKAEMK